ncbi:MAG: hypothetical protein U5K54_18240 [Cytophagales bacterium]|nr:hypothetical protein [Cytophagales bacterium]
MAVAGIVIESVFTGAGKAVEGVVVLNTAPLKGKACGAPPIKTAPGLLCLLFHKQIFATFQKH